MNSQYFARALSQFDLPVCICAEDPSNLRVQVPVADVTGMIIGSLFDPKTLVFVLSSASLNEGNIFETYQDIEVEDTVGAGFGLVLPGSSASSFLKSGTTAKLIAAANIPMYATYGGSTKPVQKIKIGYVSWTIFEETSQGTSHGRNEQGFAILLCQEKTAKPVTVNTRIDLF